MGSGADNARGGGMNDGDNDEDASAVRRSDENDGGINDPRPSPAAADDDDPPPAAEEAAAAPASAAPAEPSLEELIAHLSRDPALIALVERGVASLAAGTAGTGAATTAVASAGNRHGDEGAPPPQDEITRQVVRTILYDRANSALMDDAVVAPTVERDLVMSDLDDSNHDRPIQQQPALRRPTAHRAATAAATTNEQQVTPRSRGRPTTARSPTLTGRRHGSPNVTPPAPLVPPNTPGTPGAGGGVGTGGGAGMEAAAAATGGAAAAGGRSSFSSLGGVGVGGGEMMGVGSSSNNPLPPVKSVSFSTISAPPPNFNDDDDGDGEGMGIGYEGELDGEEVGRNSRGRSVSPPPPAFPSLLQESSYARSHPDHHLGVEDDDDNQIPPFAGHSSEQRGGFRSRSRSPTAMSSVTSADLGQYATGESTASADSSVTSFSRNTAPSVTFAVGTSFGNSLGGSLHGSTHSHGSREGHVHFSAMNPNPHLVLGQDGQDGENGNNNNNQGGSGSGTPRMVSFHDDGGDNGGDGAGRGRGGEEEGGGVSGGAEGRVGRRDYDVGEERPPTPPRSRSRSRSRSPGPFASGSGFYDRAVSWEDQTASSNVAAAANAAAAASASGVGSTHTPTNRSGLSSPSIEPALSPLSASRKSSRRGEGIQFNSVIETITEAAARLRVEQRREEREERELAEREAEQRHHRRGDLQQVAVASGNANDDGSVGAGDHGAAPAPAISAPANAADSDNVAAAAASPSSAEHSSQQQHHPSHPHHHLLTRTSSGRVVHFSALRDVAVVDTDAAAAGSLHSGSIIANDPPTAQAAAAAAAADSAQQGSVPDEHPNHHSSTGHSTGQGHPTGHQPHPHHRRQGSDEGSQRSASVVHFADDSSLPPQQHDHDSLDGAGASHSSLSLNPDPQTERLSDRLRRLIRRAEAVGNVTLEDAFGHFDPNHSGSIDATALRDGLRRLGTESFASLSLEECEGMLRCLNSRTGSSVGVGGTTESSRASGERITLLGFYRAMGRMSPPLIPSRQSDDDDDDDDADEDGDDRSAEDGGEGASSSRNRGGEEEEDDNVDDVNVVGLGTMSGHHSSLTLPATVAATATTSSTRPIPRRPHTTLSQSPVVHAHDAADRLRRIVLSAERDEGTSLESSFRLLDPSGTGYIGAEDFRRGLRRLGSGASSTRRAGAAVGGGGSQEEGEESKDEDGDGVNNNANDTDTDSPSGGYDDAFSTIDEDDCEELVTLFDANNDGLVSLLDFYRFMGRRSPPPDVGGTSGSSGSLVDDEEGDEEEDEDAQENDGEDSGNGNAGDDEGLPIAAA